MNDIFKQTIKKTKLLKNGESPVWMRITVDARRTEMMIKRSVAPNRWNQKKEYTIATDYAGKETLCIINSHTKHCESMNKNPYRRFFGGLRGGVPDGEFCSTSCSSAEVPQTALNRVFGQKKNLRNRLIF